MLRSQELQLRASEIRQRLNALAGKDTLTAEERAEVDTLSTELATVETQYRAAVQAEDSEAREHRAEGDGEHAELRALVGNARLGRYIQAAAESRAVDGREGELNAACGLGAGMVPWVMLAPPAESRHQANGDEHRADVATDRPATGNPVNQAEILPRVFARTAAAFLGVDMPSVGVGEASYPVFTSGTAAATVAEAAGQDAAAATFTANVLTPRRLTGRYIWNVEDAAVMAGLESALRSDLSMVLGDQLDKSILGRRVNDAANVKGFVLFLDAAGNARPGVLTPTDNAGADTGTNPAAVVTHDGFVEAYTEQVDGRYANSAADVRLLVNPETYRKMALTFRGAETLYSVLDYVKSIGGGLQVSGNMGDVPGAGTYEDIAIALAARGMARAAVAPVWEGIRLIRDEITQAKQGQIVLTALMLYSFAVTRPAQFAEVRFKVA